MAEETNQQKKLSSVVTEEKLNEYLKRGYDGCVEDAQEFIDHIHTLWNSIGNLYEEYAIPCAFFGFKIELNITDKYGNEVVHSSMGVGKEELNDIHNSDS